MTPNLRNCQNLLKKRGILVIVCGICQSVPNGTGIKHQANVAHKNKDCHMYTLTETSSSSSILAIGMAHCRVSTTVLTADLVSGKLTTAAAMDSGWACSLIVAPVITPCVSIQVLYSFWYTWRRDFFLKKGFKMRVVYCLSPFIKKMLQISKMDSNSRNF